MVTAPSVPNLPQVLQAIRDATPEDLAALAAKHPDRLRINHERRALQLVGCGDAIIASYGTMSIPSLAMLLS